MEEVQRPELHRWIEEASRTARLEVMGHPAADGSRLVGRRAVAGCGQPGVGGEQRWPSLVGGCRPIELTDLVTGPAWSLRHREVLVSFGVPSEVVVAERFRPAAR